MQLYLSAAFESLKPWSHEASSRASSSREWLAREYFFVRPGPPRGGQKRSLSGGLGTQGGSWFRIVRFNAKFISSNYGLWTRWCFFWFRAEIRTSADAMTLFCSSLDVEPKFEHLRRLWPLFAHHLILGRNSNICGRSDLFFCSSRDFGAPLTKGLNEIFAQGPEMSLGAPACDHLLATKYHSRE